MIDTTFIYILTDPRNGAIRYIGKANNLPKRLYSHIQDKRPNHRSCWIKGLIAIGLRPTIEVLDTVPKDEWQFWEKHYISLFKSWDFNLTNKSEGGEGTEHTLESRKKMSEAKKKNPTRYWLGKSRKGTMDFTAGRTGKTYEELFGEEMAKELKGRRSKLYSGENHPMYGRKHTPEARMKQSIARKNRSKAIL